MKYEAKVIPEGINSSKHNPLKELLLLTSASLAVIIAIVLVLTLLTDSLVGFIPPQTESRWFDSNLIDFESPAFERPKGEEFVQSEQYLMNLVAQLRQPEYQDFEFSVTVIDDEHPNAFVIPGGHIFITSALFNYVDSENGLAMVLSHEMASMLPAAQSREKRLSQNFYPKTGQVAHTPNVGYRAHSSH